MNMLVYTTKLTRRKIVAGVMVLSFLICGIILSASRIDPSRSVNGEILVSTESIQIPKLKTQDDRIEFLKSLNLEIREDPIEFREVMIPEEFDETYKKYNELQVEQGFDLEKYAGKRVMKYSYAVMNHPSGEEAVTATLLIYKGKLIGGDVASAKMDGFMHGLINS